MKAVLCVLLLAVVSQTTVSEHSQLCLTADNEIRKLFVDGRNLTPRLRFKKYLRRSDCVDLPSNSGLIAIEAKNWRGPSGIQACNTGNPTILKGWVCKPVRRWRPIWLFRRFLRFWRLRRFCYSCTFCRSWAFRRFCRCWRAHRFMTFWQFWRFWRSGRCGRLFPWYGWYSLNYDDSRWRKAKRQTCKRFQRSFAAKTLPCNLAVNKCFWSKQPGQTVRCRLKLVGAGIDPPNCEFGSATVVDTGMMTCNRKCCLNVTENNMQLTDGLTGDVDTYSIQADGYSFAIVDIDTCTFIEKVYNTDSDVVVGLIVSLTSSSSGAAYSNEIGVGIDRQLLQPYVIIVELGIDAQLATYMGNYEEFKTCITGVKNGEKQFTEPEIIEFVPPVGQER